MYSVPDIYRMIPQRLFALLETIGAGVNVIAGL